MMKLHSNISKETIANEPDIFRDFLEGLEDKVIRLDELHPSEDNDGHYIFLIWVDPDQCVEIRKKMEANMARPNSWSIELLPYTGDGLLIVSTWI